jgi:DNA modification methylase
MMVPARLAIRLQEDGWWVRSDIAWCKRAPMPESCTDRPTTAWEHVFLLTRSARYYYDAEAVKEPTEGRELFGNSRSKGPCEDRQDNDRRDMTPNWSRNMRNFWLLGPEPFPEAHFATFPTEIPRRAIMAGSKRDDTILDPFLGSGTTAVVADQLQRDCIGIELSPTYAEMAQKRIRSDNSLLCEVRVSESYPAGVLHIHDPVKEKGHPTSEAEPRVS